MTFNYMTEKEIVDSYVRNGKTKTQIKRLAELNDCSFADIRNLLDEKGVLKKINSKRDFITPTPIPKQDDVEVKKEPIEYVVPTSVWATLKEEQTRISDRIEMHKKEILRLQIALEENKKFIKVLESLIK